MSVDRILGLLSHLVIELDQAGMLMAGWPVRSKGAVLESMSQPFIGADKRPRRRNQVNLRMAMSGRVDRWRYVQGRVMIEKSHGLQAEPSVHDRHYRPVLRAGHVVMAKGIPDDNIRVFNVPVGLGPFRQPGASRVLIRVRSGGAHLVRTVRGNPQVLSNKSRPLGDAGLRVSEGQDVITWH